MAGIDAMKILGSLLSSGAMSRGSGSDILGSVIDAMTGGGQAGTGQSGDGGLGGLLGGMVGGGQAQGGIGDLLGGLLSGSGQATGGSAGGGGLGDLLGMALRQFGAAQQGNLQQIQAEVRSNMPQGVSYDQAEQQAEILIKAMINAAKSDGRIDAGEKQKIVERLGEVTPDEIAFVRREFAAPLDAQAFVRSVPRGMEQQVYVVSLMAIDLDHNAEAQYLHQLAQGFGMSGEACNQIHQQLGAPKLYR